MTLLTYCTNIHPGESWDETFANVRTHVLAVKTAVAPARPFPIGLRLSQQAAMAIDEPTAQSFQEWCAAHDCYVPTINGFPFGAFHATPVKEQVYLPDWRATARRDYTNRLAELLDFWLPTGVIGSISTVPVGFKAHVHSDEYGLVRQNLLATLEQLDRLRQKSGKRIVLALEPEPACVLATVPDLVIFLERLQFPPGLRDGIGICFDCCHLAVEFETPAQSLELLAQAGIPIGKVQISSALRLEGGDHAVAKQFLDPCYLHQVVIQAQDDNLVHYDDLPQALRAHASKIGEEWRVHFHVPIFIEKTELYGTTQFFIEATLPLLDPSLLLEVETYTWQVLPAELRTKTVTESIIREIQWLQRKQKI